MRKQSNITDSCSGRWLLLFYTVPSSPVNARMKIWRRLARSGAVQLKSAVYILPFNDENYEFCQWLMSEIAQMKGEGAFVMVDHIETMKDKEVISLFNDGREKDYGEIEKKLEELDRKINSVRKGTGIKSASNLLDELGKRLKEFEDVRSVDFFASKAGLTLKKRLDAINKELKGLPDPGVKGKPETVYRSLEDYRGRTWVTRKRPFVDRMASAWLIRKFIDKKANFQFIDEKEMESSGKNTVAFDMRGGEFTHSGDMCTFEALVRTFRIKDTAVRKIAEIVHALDIKDDKYNLPEAKGIENILLGIRKTTKDDAEILEKGMNVFEMLYASIAG